MKPSLLARWVPKVYRSSSISDGAKVLLLLLAQDMRQDGYVSVPREELARRLGRAPSKVSARLKECVEAGLLDRVVAGHKGTTAVYRATIPEAQSVPDVRDAKAAKRPGFKDAMDPQNRDAMKGQSVPHGGDATTRWAPTRASAPGVAERPSTSHFLFGEKKEVEVDRATTEPTPLSAVLHELFGKSA